PPYYNVSQGAECTAWALQILAQSGVLLSSTSPDLEPSDHTYAYNILQTIMFNPYQEAFNEATDDIINQISNSLSAISQYGQGLLNSLFNGYSDSIPLDNTDGSGCLIKGDAGGESTIQFFDPSSNEVANLQYFVNGDGGTTSIINNTDGSLWTSI